MNEVIKTKDWLFVSDVDDTLLGDETGLTALADAVKEVRDRMIMAYNSSRPCASQRKSLTEQAGLPRPDYLIGALGTEIQSMDSDADFRDYASRFAENWDRERVARLMNRLGFTPHEDEYQTAFKASYHVPGRLQHMFVEEQLKAEGLNVRIIFSGESNLDVIPQGADKGIAVEYLRRRHGFEADQVVVAGDSANDRDMFHHGFKGIIVGNADAQLKSLSGTLIFHARGRNAHGVLEGLRHWGVVPS